MIRKEIKGVNRELLHAYYKRSQIGETIIYYIIRKDNLAFELIRDISKT